MLSAMNHITDSDNHLFKSAGAPGGSTGAPLEGTCAVSGCHNSDVSVNSGPGIISLTLLSGDTAYQPNAFYQIDLSLNHTGVDKFGFQAVVLKDQDSSSVGQISLVDAIRTQEYQVQDTSSIVFGRNYVTHTIDGNIAQPTGWGQWSFGWTAPPAGNGDITIYLAALAANNNGTKLGDTVYTTSLTLSEDTTTLLTSVIRKESSIIKIGPSPFKDKLFVEILKPNPKHSFNLELVDLKGNVVFKQSMERVAVVSRNNLPGGIYLIKLTDRDSLIAVKKIIAN